MTHPVSVQIITLNEEATIAACLASVLATEPAEVIVIDGGSILANMASKSKNVIGHLSPRPSMSQLTSSGWLQFGA